MNAVGQMDTKQLAGSVKVAILTNAMGVDAAKPILDRLDKEERQIVSKLQSKLRNIPKFITQKIAREFIEQTGIPLQLIQHSEAVSRKVEKVEKSESPAAEPSSRLTAIQDIEPGQLLQLIKDEHPQTIAVILVHLAPNVASLVLGNLPDEIRADVALRIANLNKVLVGMVGEIEKVFDEILKNKGQTSSQEAGGVGRLAEMLNKIDGTVVEEIIEGIEKNNPEVAEKVKQMMFVFEDIVMVDDKGLQKVLRSIESKELSIALKAASDAVKQKIYRNMSQRASEILKEEIDVIGAVRMKDVTDAQQKITRIIQEMERKGELVIAGRGGDEFV
jgi:flagellar motor switch protein FliG